MVRPTWINADDRDPGRVGRQPTESLFSGGSNSLRRNPSIRLLERPEYKRRWTIEPWEKRQERALREWLLDRLEDKRFWFDAQGRPLPRSVGPVGR